MQTTLSVAENDSFTVPLSDGNYRLRINPAIDSITAGISREFTFTISSGNVSNLLPTDTSTAITASGGIYSLTLGRPQLAGRVFDTDGTTPLPGMRIYFGTPGVVENFGPLTDSNGNFVFDLTNKLSNGAVSVWALDAYTKKLITTGISVGTNVESVTITNGYGPTNIVLRAKAREPGRTAPQDGLHAGQQFGERERLDQVVVAAGGNAGNVTVSNAQSLATSGASAASAILAQSLGGIGGIGGAVGDAGAAGLGQRCTGFTRGI